MAHGSEGLSASPGEAASEPWTAEEIEVGRRLFAQKAGFVAGAGSYDSLPPVSLPEVAFAGRSNVGKSSLVNALTGRRTLARISVTPGRTQQINFFDLGHRLMLVDLPGYGYARAARARIRRWTRLIEDYLKGRPSLRRVCLLVDARHGLMAHDRGLMDLLDRAALSYQIVLTKTDKLGPAALEETRLALAREIATHPAAHPLILASSAREGTGVPELRAALASLATPAPIG